MLFPRPQYNWSFAVLYCNFKCHSLEYKSFLAIYIQDINHGTLLLQAPNSVLLLGRGKMSSDSPQNCDDHNERIMFCELLESCNLVLPFMVGYGITICVYLYYITFCISVLYYIICLSPLYISISIILHYISISI